MRTTPMLLAAVLLISACSLTVGEAPDGGVILCSAASPDCPTGTTCSESLGRCVPVGREEDPPGITGFAVHQLGRDGSTLTEDVDLFGAGTTIVIRFGADEPLGSEPAVTLGLPGTLAPAVREGAGEDPYEYRYLVPDDSPEGPVSVSVDLADAVGNPASFTFPNRLRIDTTPPALGTPAAIILVPGPLNLQRSRVDAVTSNTRVEVAVVMNERLLETPLVTTAAGGGCNDAPNPQVVLPDTEQNPFYVFYFDYWRANSAVEDDCVHTVYLDAVDIAGNRTVTPIEAATFRVDTTPPAEPTGLRLLRAPWRSEDNPDGLLAVEVTVEAGDTPVFFDSGDPSDRREIGRAEPVFSGAVPLLAADRAAVWASALDTAGNESRLVPVETGAWTASLGGRISTDDRSNPNAFFVLEASDPVLVDPRRTEPSTTQLQALYPFQPGSVTVPATRRWKQRRHNSPPSTTAAGLAHVSATGRTVMYGGFSTEQILGTHWEWDGVDWSFVDLVGRPSPGTLVGPSATYDVIRDRVVLFGGLSTFQAIGAETWEWNGSTWTQQSAAGEGPPGAVFAPMVYDPARGRSILLGSMVFGDPTDEYRCPTGYLGPRGEFPLCLRSETWEWDGVFWEERCDGLAEVCPAGVPPPRHSYQLAFDEARGVAVLHGGMGLGPHPTDPAQPDVDTVLGDTWEWDGAAGVWTEVVVTDGPGARFGGVAFYNPDWGPAGAVMLYGGCSGGELFDCGVAEAQKELWYFDPSAPAWVSLGSVSTEGLSFAGAAYDVVRGELVVNGGGESVGRIGGRCDSVCNGRDGEEWGDPGEEACQCRYDRTYLLDSRSADGVTEDRLDWSEAAGPSPAPQTAREFALAWDADREVAVLFGGTPAGSDCDGWTVEAYNRSCPTLWEWNGRAWSVGYVAKPNPDLSDPPPVACVDEVQPCARNGAAMAHVSDAAGNGGVLLFGGSGADCSEPPTGCASWIWDGAAWTPAADSGISPPARLEHQLTTVVDPATGERLALLFGGVFYRQNETDSCPVGSVDPDGDTVDFERVCPFGDLWAFRHGEGWAQVDVAVGDIPAPRFDHMMTFHAADGEVVLYGGCLRGGGNTRCEDGGGTNVGGTWDWSTLDETWTWNILDWTQLSAGNSLAGWTRELPSFRPPRLVGAGFAYDSSRARAVLFGGSWDDGGGSNDVFEWDGTDWARVEPRGILPAVRRGHLTYYQSSSARLVSVGGRATAEVWESDLSPELRPAAIFEVAWDAAGVSDPTDPAAASRAVTGLTVVVDANGRGFGLHSDPGDIDGDLFGEPVAGAVVAAWDGRRSRWVDLDCTASGTARLECTPASAAEARAFVFSGTDRIYLRISTAGKTGNGRPVNDQVPLAELDVEYVEATVDYQWTPPQP